MKVYVVATHVTSEDYKYRIEEIIGIYSTTDKAKNVAEKECERIRNEEEVLNYQYFDTQTPPQGIHQFVCDDCHGGINYTKVYLEEMEVE